MVSHVLFLSTGILFVLFNRGRSSSRISAFLSDRVDFLLSKAPPKVAGFASIFLALETVEIGYWTSTSLCILWHMPYLVDALRKRGGRRAIEDVDVLYRVVLGKWAIFGKGRS
jgi:hypothetical protein